MFAVEVWSLANRERWADLIALSDTFLAQHTRADGLEAFATVMRESGVALVFSGRAAEGLARQQTALALLPSTRPRLRANGYSALAWSAQHLNDHGSADRHYAAMDSVVAEHVGGRARRPLRLRALSERSGNLIAWHEAGARLKPASLERALALAREAGVLARAETDPTSATIALLFEGEALHYLGRLDEAEAALRTVRASADETLWYYADWDLGRVALRRGRFADAERHLRAALAWVTANDDPEDIRNLLYELGALYETQGRLDEAAGAHRAAIDALERYQARTGADDQWLGAQHVWQRPYRGLCRVLVRQGRTAEAFALIDGARARYLGLFQARAARLARGDAEARRLAATFAALEAARDSLAVPLPEHARARLEARVQTLQNLGDRATALPRTPRLDFAALYEHLGEHGQTVVAYVLDEAEPFLARAPLSLAFVVTPDTTVAVVLGVHAPGVEWLVGAVGGAFLGGEAAGVTGRSFDLTALGALYRAVLAPVRARIAGRRLVVIPDGALFAVPFGALVTRSASRFDVRGARFVAEDLAVSTELAAGLLVRPAPPEAFTSEALIVGRSRFAGEGLADLPNVRRELARVRGAFNRPDLLREDGATEAAFFDRAASARVVHIATHADLSDVSPLYHALRFAPGAGGDGRLRLHELRRHMLPNALVVLSGCRTARGRLHAGEGMAGLQYAFRTSGARSVLATLWLVDDAATADVMASFHGFLARGVPKDVALQRAQVGYLRAHEDARASPFYWAAPVLYGDASALRPWPAPRTPYATAGFFGWIGVAGLVAAGVLGVAYRRKRSHPHG